MWKANPPDILSIPPQDRETPCDPKPVHFPTVCFVDFGRLAYKGETRMFSTMPASDPVGTLQRDRPRDTLAELGLDKDLVDLVVELSPCRGFTELSVQTFVSVN